MTRKSLIFAALLLVSLPTSIAFAQSDEGQANNPYDAELANELGADEYGMRSYFFVTLMTGKVEIEDKNRKKEIFSGHFANMSRLASEGKLVLAGPLIDARPKRGVYIFNAATIEEAEELVESDPAVKAGVFDYEIAKFYSSAVLMKINELHGKIQKTRIE